MRCAGLEKPTPRRLPHVSVPGLGFRVWRIRLSANSTATCLDAGCHRCGFVRVRRFLAKNFATTVSPWIVTMEALAPYRQAWTRPAEDPQPLDHLESKANREHGAIDIRLEVWLESEKARNGGSAPTRISSTSFRHQYWSVAQMVTHHTVGGCALNAGDLFGGGTVSGPGVGEAGAIIEVTRGGQQPIMLDTGEERRFLEDGDAVVLPAIGHRPTARPRLATLVEREAFMKIENAVVFLTGANRGVGLALANAALAAGARTV